MRFSSTSPRRVSAKLLGLVLVAAAVGGWAGSAAAAPTEVDLKLVLAVDVSGSISNDELRLERDGTADAFLDPEVVKAIQSGALGRIAVAMLDFSSPEFDRIVINWQIIEDGASAAAFAQMVRDLPRTPGRRTSVSSALERGALMLEASEKDIIANRRVIDVSGDGPNNDGNPMMEAHDKTIAQGIVVNGLPVMDDTANGYYPNLYKYYAACVAGGRGSFVVVVRNYRDFGAAMRHKLILEISDRGGETRNAAVTAPAHPALVPVAAPAEAQPPSGPEVLRPGPNEFFRSCDIVGGFGGFRRF